MKAKIIGIGNEGAFNFIIVEKNKDFFLWLSNLLFDAFGYQDEFVVYDELKNKKGVYYTRKKNIKNYVDRHHAYGRNELRADVFYGKEKVFITILLSQAKRNKLMKALEKNSVWRIPKLKKSLKKVVKEL